MTSNSPRMVRILDVKEESPSTRSILFHDGPSSKAQAGQFLMVWIPGVDEVPMSVSMTRPKGLAGITVKVVGEATRALCNMKAGELMGIKGPYGNPFTAMGKHLLLVGGGTGLAPLMVFLEGMPHFFDSITLAVGAKTADELIFVKRAKEGLSKVNGDIIIATEDGSHGMKGLATEAMKAILAKKPVDAIYTCGPEAMIREVFDIAERLAIPLQASLERIMKCGIGICGSCCIGKYVVCRDGPVFTSAQLRGLCDELGRFKRDHSGRLVRI